MAEKMEKINKRPVWAGFKLGALLQIGGMGPISLLLFQLAALLPLKSVLGGVVAVTLADACYILISLLGIIGIIKQVKKTSNIFKKINGVIIIYLGLSFILMSLSARISYLDFYDWNGKSVFAGVFILTMLNPVTVICYTGVFNAKVLDLHMSNKRLFLFGLGTLLSTPLFMLLVVTAGALGGAFLPDVLVDVMNVLVGLLLIYWGTKYIFPSLNEKLNWLKKKEEKLRA